METTTFFKNKGDRMKSQIEFRKNKLLLEGIVFTEIVKKFCNGLTDDNLFDMKKSLELCLKDFPRLLKEYNESNERLERIRKLIQIQGIVEECREHLDFIARTRKANAQPVMAELDKFTSQFARTHFAQMN